MTKGDVKSVKGDPGHAEAEMVVDIYSRISNEDRRLNAMKLDEQFYVSLDESESKSADSESDKDNNFIDNLMKFMSDESNHEQLQTMLNLANN